MSVDVVRAAAPMLARSPVYRLVRAHLAGLFAATYPLSTQSRLLTGQATVALVRALLSTAAEARGRDDALQATLDVRMALYIDAHLDDPELTAERIAAAHNISLRHLYAVWARAGHDRGPMQWITNLRLHRARDRLASRAPTQTTIAAVARDCGFTSPSHFSRRFRETFGESPRDWCAANAPSRPGG